MSREIEINKMSEEEALKILNQIENFDDLCECVFKKEHTCIGCREKALKIILKNYKKLQQENKQLKSILTELEEWLKDMFNKTQVIIYCVILIKLQELKEKYKWQKKN